MLLILSVSLKERAIFPAVDGDALSASGGRLRKQKQQWRLAYDRKEHGAHVRVVAHLRMTALASAGGANPWRQYGCLKSHEAVLTMAQAQLSHHPLCLVCEDDLMLGKTIATSVDFIPFLDDKLAQLTRDFPEWCLLLLGGTAVFGFNNKNAFTDIPGIRHAGYIMQAHACLWRRAPQTNDVMNVALEFMAKGFQSDNSLASAMTRFPGRCFCLDPGAFLQNPAVPSNLQTWSSLGGQSGYNAALKVMRTKAKASPGRKQRKWTPLPKSSMKYSRCASGSGTIHKKALKKIRQDIGRKAGAVKAGGSSSAKDVAKKVNLMKRWLAKNGSFPSRNVAQSKWNVGKSLWRSTRDECTS